MKIQLNQFERRALQKMASAYSQKTGDRFSIQFIMLLLAERYAEKLQKDLDQILDEKVRAFEEEKESK